MSCQIISTRSKPLPARGFVIHEQHPLSLVLEAALESAEHAMTSNQTRRSFGGNPLKTKTHSRRSSSSTTSQQIETPSDTSPSASPSFDMPPRVNGAHPVDALAEDMEKVEVNGSRKTRRGMPLDRKQSTPMMPAFMVSAPGKVIVFGEHAVVHGKVHQTVHCLGGQADHRFRPPLQLLSLFDPIYSSPHFRSQNGQYLFDFPT
jgi:hypothetical protein